jgi:uncharacterized damage-inducible protein DinB
MYHPVTIIDDNIRYLQQGLELLQVISDENYTHASPPMYTSGVGGHLRHCLDHYFGLLAGIDGQKVDYDARQRDAEIETCRNRAIECTEQLIEDLKQLPAEALGIGLECKMDCGGDGEVICSDSSVRREMQFLVSHTVHHYALIAMILRHQGIEPPADFGVAPSTVRFRESQLKCAQ